MPPITIQLFCFCRFKDFEIYLENGSDRKTGQGNKKYFTLWIKNIFIHMFYNVMRSYIIHWSKRLFFHTIHFYLFFSAFYFKLLFLSFLCLPIFLSALILFFIYYFLSFLNTFFSFLSLYIFLFITNFSLPSSFYFILSPYLSLFPSCHPLFLPSHHRKKFEILKLCICYFYLFICLIPCL